VQPPFNQAYSIDVRSPNDGSSGSNSAVNQSMMIIPKNGQGIGANTIVSQAKREIGNTSSIMDQSMIVMGGTVDRSQSVLKGGHRRINSLYNQTGLKVGNA
jgi:hypothetical protein